MELARSLRHLALCAATCGICALNSGCDHDAPNPSAYTPTPMQWAKLDKKQQKGPKRFDKPKEAQAFFVYKRSPDQVSPLPMERYLAAREQAARMPRYSTATATFLPSTADAELLGAQPLVLSSWEPLGPGNIGGRTRAMLIDPHHPNVLYGAGVAGGVWKSTDSGANWSPMSDDIANLAVNSMTMDPSAPEVIYVGTGEGFFNADAVRGMGVFKTTDSGTTWSHLASTGSSDFYYVNDIVVSPNDNQVVYAATRTGVWRSRNGGGAWEQVHNPATLAGCLDLAIRSDRITDYVLASCGSFTTATVYRNVDAADDLSSWSPVLTEASMGRTSLAIAPSNQDYIYALASSIDSTSNYNLGLHAVFRSTDGGDSWTAQVRNTDPVKLNTALLSNTVYAFLSDCGFGTDQYFNQGWYDNVIAVDPLDPNRVWAGGIDLFRSDDGGQNWGMASHWWANTGNAAYVHADQHAILFHPDFDGSTNKTMFVSNDGGIYRTLDARAAVDSSATAPCTPAWSSGEVAWGALNNSFGVTQFYHGAAYPGGIRYFGGTQDNGTLRGTDSGGTNAWVTLLGGDGGAVAVDPTDSDVLYAENTRLSISKSVNGGASFAPATNGITESSGHFLFIAPFTMDPSAPDVLWTGGWYLWRTLDGAANWSQASAILAGAGSVSAIGVSPADSNYVAAGMSDGVIHHTTSGLATGSATSWAAVQPRVGFVSSLTYDPTDTNTVYATYSTFGGTHVWKSSDGGASWTALDGAADGALPDIPVHSLVVDPGDPDTLYIGTDIGVFVSLDGGGYWQVENTGYANVVTESLSIDPLSEQLFAFTHGRGTWRVSLPSGSCGVADYHLEVPAQTVSTVETFSACLSVRGGDGGLRVISGGELTLQAGQQVVLENGFSVAADGVFHAVISTP